MRTQNAPYSYPNRGCLSTFLLLLLLSLLVGLVRLHTFFTYLTYQQGRCIITSGTTTEHGGGGLSKGSKFYTADFQYTVSTKDGQQADTGGSAGLDDYHYSDYQDAQQVVNSYTVGRVYDCWYNPADPTHAVLDFRGYSIYSSIFDYLETSLGYLIGFCFLLLFYHNFSIYFCLRHRGVLTQGRVVENFVRRTNSGRRTYSRIFYSPRDAPLQSYQIERAGAYMVNSPQPVCYDPVNPKIAQYGGRPSGYVVMAYLAAVIMGILIALGVLVVIWYGV